MHLKSSEVPVALSRQVTGIEPLEHTPRSQLLHSGFGLAGQERTVRRGVGGLHGAPGLERHRIAAFLRASPYPQDLRKLPQILRVGAAGECFVGNHLGCNPRKPSVR